MKRYDVDFHIHSKYSGGTSSSMELPLIAREAELKGLHLVGTGDALDPRWLKHLKENLIEDSHGIYFTKDAKTHFMITAEVEDSRRVHHLLLLPSRSAAESLIDRFRKYSNDIGKDGRPSIRLTGEEIVDYAQEVDAMVGPAHAFTPWTAIYKEYGSIEECYGSNSKRVRFLELGLSADSYLADRIPELSGVTFLSNSDTHSPWPHRLGREFNRLELKNLDFDDIRDVIGRKKGRKFVLNVGLNPKEGKYHLSACSRCYQRFMLKDALMLKWKCPECNGRIKKGVFDRIEELAKFKEPKHPWHRPPYLHIIPLAEVISVVTGIRTITSKTIQERWKSLVDLFGTEINVLVDSDIAEVKRADPEVGRVIEKFRQGKIQYVGGGGGQYGRPTLKGEGDEFWGSGQRSLTDF